MHIGSLPPCPRDTWQQRATTSATRHLGASWDNFTDPQSNISTYYVQFFSQQGGSTDSSNSAASDATAQLPALMSSTTVVNLTDLINVGLVNR